MQKSAPAPIGAQAPERRKPGRWRSRVVLLALFAGAQLSLSGCRPEPPEQALRSTISNMQTAAEAHDVDALFEPIGDDFSGSDGMDRTTFRRYVLLSGLRDKSVRVQLGPLDVKMFDGRASVSFTAALSGGANWLPDRAQVYDVDTGWRREGDDWLLISAKWKPKL